MTKRYNSASVFKERRDMRDTHNMFDEFNGQLYGAAFMVKMLYPIFLLLDLITCLLCRQRDR